MTGHEVKEEVLRAAPSSAAEQDQVLGPVAELQGGEAARRERGQPPELVGGQADGPEVLAARPLGLPAADVEEALGLAVDPGSLDRNLPHAGRAVATGGTRLSSQHGTPSGTGRRDDWERVVPRPGVPVASRATPSGFPPGHFQRRHDCVTPGGGVNFPHFPESVQAGSRGVLHPGRGYRRHGEDRRGAEGAATPRPPFPLVLKVPHGTLARKVLDAPASCGGGTG